VNVLVLNPPNKSTTNVVRDLIYGCWCKGKRIGGAKIPPLNLLYIASVLKTEGHDVHFIDALAEQKTLQDITPTLRHTDVIIMSTSSMSFQEDVAFLRAAKNLGGNPTSIVFGSHPTFMPDQSLREDSIDLLVQREPEFIIRDVVASIARGGTGREIRGVAYKKDGRTIINKPPPFIKNLDDLPFPDRSLLPADVDYFNPIIKRTPYTALMTSRGCPGQCTFCTVPKFYGGLIRSRSVKNVLSELRLIESQGYKEVWFRDETFTYFPKRNKEICRKIIEEGIDLTWICNARVGTVDRKMMKRMKKAGCHLIKYGVESGNQNILNNVKKGIRVSQTTKDFRNANSVGLDTHAHIMLGMPGDTKKTIEETIKFTKKIKPTTATFGICTPYPGTELYASLKKHTNLELDHIHEKAYSNELFTDLTAEELEGYIKKAYRSFYLRPTYLLKQLGKIKNLDDLKRITIAGSNVFSFSIEKP